MTLSELVSRFSRYVHKPNDVDVTQMCGLAAGTTAATIKTVNAITYSLYNQQITKAATDNIAVTAGAAQAVGTTCYYLVSANLSGTVTTTKGVDNAYALPSTPAGNVAIGAFLITTDATHTFTAGTTLFAAAGITAAFYDIDAGIAVTLINLAQNHLERGVTITRNGRQFTVSEFDHMLVRGTATIVAGNTTVTLPFPNYKEFRDDGVTLTDSSSARYRMSKVDFIPLGAVSEGRPEIISRVPTAETTFTPDGNPAKTFGIYPKADASYTLDVIAYQYSPDLDGVLYSTNWLTENAPDVLLFGALCEYAAYFPGETRIAEWERRWQEAAYTLYAAQRKEKHSGTTIKTNFPNPLAAKSGTSDIVTGVV